MTTQTHWRKPDSSPFTHDECTHLATKADAAIASSNLLANGTNQALTYLGHEARALDAIDSPVVFVNTHTGAGGVNATLLPLEVSMLVHFGTGIPGRSHRNRFYWPGQDTSLLDVSPRDGLFTTGTVTGYTDLFAAYISAIESDLDFTQVVASAKLGSFLDVSFMLIRRRPASQRRREPS